MDVWNFDNITGQKSRQPRPNYVESKMINVDAYVPAKPSVKAKRETPYQAPAGGFNIPEAPSLFGTQVAQETLDTGPRIESTGEVPKAQDLPPTKKETLEDVIKQEGITNRQLAFLQSGAQFFADVFNANSAYAAASGEAQLNIIQARNQAADALYRGRQARTEAESEGRAAGESALLAMAVQGQDVGGAAVQKIQGSYEAMGIFNGMREEINAIREALGYELQEVAYDYQTRNAAIARDSAIIGSGLSMIASGIGTL